MERKVILSIGCKFAMFQFHPSFMQPVQVSWEVLAPHSHCRPGIWDFFISSSLLDCPGVLSLHKLLIQPSAVRLGNEIHLPGIPGLDSEPGLFVPSICSACLSFVTPTAQGMLECLQHSSRECPLALQETPTGDCWIFNPHS